MWDRKVSAQNKRQHPFVWKAKVTPIWTPLNVRQGLERGLLHLLATRKYPCSGNYSSISDQVSPFPRKWTPLWSDFSSHYEQWDTAEEESYICMLSNARTHFLPSDRPPRTPLLRDNRAQVPTIYVPKSFFLYHLLDMLFCLQSQTHNVLMKDIYILKASPLTKRVFSLLFKVSHK